MTASTFASTNIGDRTRHPARATPRGIRLVRLVSAVLHACCDRIGATLLSGVVVCAALVIGDPRPGVLASAVLIEPTLITTFALLVVIRVRSAMSCGLHAKVSRLHARVSRVESRIKTEDYMHRHHRERDRSLPWTPPRPVFTLIEGGLAGLEGDAPTLQLPRYNPALYADRYYGRATAGG